MADQNNPSGVGADGVSIPDDYTQAGSTVPLSDANAAVPSYQSAEAQAGTPANVQPFSNPYADTGSDGAATVPVNATPSSYGTTSTASNRSQYDTQYAQAANAQYAQPAAQTYYDANGQPIMAPTSQGYTGQGTVPLVLGICSIVFAGLIGLVLGIIAIIKGKKALEANPEDGRAKAGKITGIVGVVLSTLLSLLAIGVIVASGIFLSNPDNQQKIEQSLESIASGDYDGYDYASEDRTDEEGIEDLEPAPLNDDKDAAVESAKSYNEMFHMSKQGLIDQLTSEYGDHFTEEAAQAAVDSLDADWNANALATAEDYAGMYMSKKGIYNQLAGEYGAGFTAEEAQYAIDNVKADWNNNALQTAKSYLEFSPEMATDELREMLTDEEYGDGFTAEEAAYAIEHLNDSMAESEDAKAAA